MMAVQHYTMCCASPLPSVPCCCVVCYLLQLLQDGLWALCRTLECTWNRADKEQSGHYYFWQCSVQSLQCAPTLLSQHQSSWACAESGDQGPVRLVGVSGLTDQVHQIQDGWGHEFCSESQKREKFSKQAQCGAWALEMSFTRPVPFQYFWQCGE